MANIVPFSWRRRRWTRPVAYGGSGGGQGGNWLRFAPLWLGAILLGLAYGANLSSNAPASADAGPGVRVPPSEGSEQKEERRFPGIRLAPSAGEERGAFRGSRKTFALCHTGDGANCVVDGDTIWMDGVKIRIAGIDAPETHPPRCAREEELGEAATRRLRALLNSGAVTTSSIDRDEDSYGRKLRNVQVDGADVGGVLVGEGLARWYGRGRRSWC